MRPILLIAVVLTTALGACDRTPQPGNEGGSASINAAEDGSFSIRAGENPQAPSIDAKLSIPGLKFAPSDMDLNGIKLLPGTQVTGMSILGESGKGGQVKMAYTLAGPPADVLAYYRREAVKAGYALTADGAGTLSATKPDDGGKSTLQVTAAAASGGGTAGVLLVSGK